MDGCACEGCCQLLPAHRPLLPCLTLRHRTFGPPAWCQVVIVNPAAPSPGDYTTRTEVQTEEYEQAVIFDHVIGRRT